MIAAPTLMTRTRFCLFRPFPDPFRKSMMIYADQLFQGIHASLAENEEVIACLPPNIRLKPALVRYWDQYVRYQRFGRTAAGDVNHVVDHGYGHLVRGLPPETSIVTFHDATVVKTPGASLRTRLSLRYSLGAIRKAARVITDSESARNDFLKLADYPESKVTVVYPGIDESFRILADRDAERARLRLPARYVLHVGHTLPYMNTVGVLRAMDLLIHDLGADVSLVKVGEPFTREQESLLDRLNLRSSTVALGKVPFADLPAIYNCAEALIYLPNYAGFGLPPLEAMACGTPVVCSSRGSLPEVVGDAAILTEPDDAHEAATQLARLLTDPHLRETYRARGEERARRFRWSKTAQEVLAIYREVANA